MNKALSKPMSSPGRAASDKFPPPLLRFLRSNVGSRSRGRSRSSPMFNYLRTRKTTPAAVLETTPEPSSPKVTCIGQVRVRRSKKLSRRRRVRKPFWCWKKSELSCFRGFWGKWGMVFRFGYCKKVDDVAEDSVTAADEKKVVVGKGRNGIWSNNTASSRSFCSDRISTDVVSVQEDCRRRASVDSCSISPPKNALLLTRCRSAPYRSSSLAGRFWSSPSKGEDGDESQIEHKSKSEEEESCENGVEEDKEEGEEGRVSECNLEETEELKGGVAEEVKVEQQQHPLMLTRCKSEPARTGERLMQVKIEGHSGNNNGSFWNLQRRLGNAVVEPCPSSHPNS